MNLTEQAGLGCSPLNVANIGAGDLVTLKFFRLVGEGGAGTVVCRVPCLESVEVKAVELSAEGGLILYVERDRIRVEE